MILRSRPVAAYRAGEPELEKVGVVVITSAVRPCHFQTVLAIFILRIKIARMKLPSHIGLFRTSKLLATVLRRLVLLV